MTTKELTTTEIKKKIGSAYVHGVFEHEQTPFVEEQFQIIRRINHYLFKQIPFKVEFVSTDPYESSKVMRDSFKKTGYVKIYTEYDGHPYLDQNANNEFRAIHDIFAHMVCGCPFTFEGEYMAYLEQRKYYPPSTWKVLFAEIPAQTCAYYYSKGFSFKQRAIEAPSEWLEMCKDIKFDYSDDAVLKKGKRFGELVRIQRGEHNVKNHYQNQ